MENYFLPTEKYTPYLAELKNYISFHLILKSYISPNGKNYISPNGKLPFAIWRNYTLSHLIEKQHLASPNWKKKVTSCLIEKTHLA
jgi:hypothetical protein